MSPKVSCLTEPTTWSSTTDISLRAGIRLSDWLIIMKAKSSYLNWTGIFPIWRPMWRIFCSTHLRPWLIPGMRYFLIPSLMSCRFHWTTEATMKYTGTTLTFTAESSWGMSGRFSGRSLKERSDSFSELFWTNCRFESRKAGWKKDPSGLLWWFNEKSGVLRWSDE